MQIYHGWGVPKETEQRKQNDNKMLNIGLLILRIGIGLEFVIHGALKWIDGPDEWIEIGRALSIYGINTAPMVFGFLAIFLEIIGGVFLILGIFMRANCFFLLVILSVALGKHISHNDSFFIYSHAMEAVILFLSLLFIGPGKYTIGNWLVTKR